MNRALLNQLNQTELIELLNQREVRASQGTARETLIRRLLGEEVEVVPNPIDFQRKEIMDLFDQYADRLRTQTMCHQDCYRHTDGEVIRCRIKAQGVIARKRERENQ